MRYDCLSAIASEATCATFDQYLMFGDLGAIPEDPESWMGELNESPSALFSSCQQIFVLPC
ncbi:MAG TPA: hypothetical protein VMV59_05315 [Candidatus Dormibacteraeota bacterium]|nr:hypothetical protein [Candidatus Dormibacteraeota bacterium]